MFGVFQGRGHKPRNVGSLQKLEAKSRKQALLSESPEGNGPAGTLDFSSVRIVADAGFQN